MSVQNINNEFLNATVATFTEIAYAVNQTSNETLAGKTMIDFEWFDDSENITSTFNSTGNETVDGRTMFYYPGMTHNVPAMKEENATSFMIVLLTIVIIVICASIYKFYVVPNRQTRATNTDTESKFRLMENELEHQHEDRF
ncbi:unnamed protein product [Oikopleura dioica]|uniref:Uncharacterized protein n=1 Tax=Oikopleura dioica TaxID=34765 RepID=E4Y8H1_OIKDI|nr:unnamed protein product [Oikopleura dioica]